MCGIAGILNLDKQQVSVDDINILTDLVSRRGPDGKGIWLSDDNTKAFGHRRLSILDTSERGRQPMSFGNGRYWITYNGEVYNFLEIRKELLDSGYQFESDSDTEVILAAYDKWGAEMLNKFNGMWAFAICDTKDDTVFLSRDRFGVKPLYYFYDNDRFIFASEVQALHSILGLDHPLNSKVIKDIARGGFVNHGSSETYLENVFSLPAGHNLLVIKEKIEVSRWYNLKRVDVPKSFKEQAVYLKDLIFDACKIRLRSDVPVGTCLSGGVDSGSISAVISQFKPKDEDREGNYTHRGFCASFPDTVIDESRKALKLAEQVGVDLDIIKIKPPSRAELELAMKSCDGPMHSLAFFPIWELYKHIRESGVKVTLDGQGPDEMLGGYQPLPEALIAAVQLLKPSWFIDVYKTYSSQGESVQNSSKKFAKNILKNFWSYYFKYYGKKFLIKIGIYKSDFHLSKQTVSFNNYFDESLYNQFFQSPLPGILNQYDRCSMASGVECRMPFMDYRVVEFIFSLPVDSKVGGGYTKRILREAMAGILPDEIRLEKNKIGFNAPLVEWFRGSLKDFMLEEMRSEEFLKSQYFDGNKLKNDFEKFLISSNPQWSEVWHFWPPVHVSWWLKRLK